MGRFQQDTAATWADAKTEEQGCKLEKPLPYTQCLMRVVSVHFHRCGHIQFLVYYTRLDGKGQECSTHATVPENGYVFLYLIKHLEWRNIINCIDHMADHHACQRTVDRE